MKSILFYVTVLVMALGFSNAYAGQVHTVRKGETLSKIGRQYSVPWRSIQSANGLKSTRIFPDQKLQIPESRQAAKGEKGRYEESPQSTEQPIREPMETSDEEAEVVRTTSGYPNPIVRDVDDAVEPTYERASASTIKSVDRHKPAGKAPAAQPAKWVKIPAKPADSAFKKWNPGDAKTIEEHWESIKKLPAFRALPEGQQWALYRTLIADEYVEDVIPDGWKAYQMTAGDKRGRTYIVYNRVADLSKTGPLTVHVYRAEGVPLEIVHVIYCNNVAYGEPLHPAVPKQEEPGEEIGKLPPVFREVKYQRKMQTSTHEVDVGAGIWKGETAYGTWWFAQYKWFLESQARPFAGGYISPVVGAFASGNMGETDEGFEWNNAGIGPQAGVMWNGITSKGYTHQVQLMFRLLYEHMHGQNRSIGYHKDEDHVVLGYYLEYLRRFHPELMVILYSEGWFDLGGGFSSTWKGDKLTDLTSLTVGVKFHKDLNENWSTRLGVQVGYQPEESRLGGNVHLELRYDKNDITYVFGPSFDVNLMSDIPAEVGEWVIGGFGRIEFRHRVIREWTETRMEEVQPSDIELLQY